MERRTWIQKFMDSLPRTPTSYHFHGEEDKSHTTIMVSQMLGSRVKLLHKRVPRISEKRILIQRFMDLLPRIQMSFHFHGEEDKMLIVTMESLIHGLRDKLSLNKSQVLMNLMLQMVSLMDGQSLFPKWSQVSMNHMLQTASSMDGQSLFPKWSQVSMSLTLQTVSLTDGQSHLLKCKSGMVRRPGRDQFHLMDSKTAGQLLKMLPFWEHLWRNHIQLSMYSHKVRNLKLSVLMPHILRMEFLTDGQRLQLQPLFIKRMLLILPTIMLESMFTKQLIE